MKAIQKLFILSVAVFLFCSCEEPIDESGMYMRTYTYNYFVRNGLDSDVVFRYVATSKNSRYSHIDKSFGVSPAKAVLIDTQVTLSGSNRADQIPVLTADNKGKYVLYDYDNRKKYYDPYITIEHKGKMYQSSKPIDDILLTEYYELESANDTTFNFYFTIDQTYIATLDEVVDNGMQ